ALDRGPGHRRHGRGERLRPRPALAPAPCHWRSAAARPVRLDALLRDGPAGRLRGHEPRNVVATAVVNRRSAVDPRHRPGATRGKRPRAGDEARAGARRMIRAWRQHPVAVASAAVVLVSVALYMLLTLPTITRQ